MVQRFTEMYYDDAVRFAQYIQATEGGEIELVKEDADGFPPAFQGDRRRGFRKL